MGTYLTYRQRLMIETLIKRKTPVKEIAQLVGVCYSTVYKELKRGRVLLLDKLLKEYVSYSADVSQQKHDYAQTSKGRPIKIGSNREYADFLRDKIKKDKFSPAAALSSARLQGFTCSISVNTLYSYIDKGYIGVSNKHLWRKGGFKKRVRLPLMPHKVVGAPGIDDRPDYINDRSVLGHWEMDLVCGKQSTLGALLVLTERVSRFEVIRKIPDKTSASVVAALAKIARKYDIHSITVDNGAEFRDYFGLRAAVKKRKINVYYCHPYRSGERGSNENANSIIRRWIPKGTVIADYTNKEIQCVQDWINHYPRRVLGYCCAADYWYANARA